MVSSTLRLAQNAPLAPTATPVLIQKIRLNTPYSFRMRRAAREAPVRIATVLITGADSAR